VFSEGEGFVNAVEWLPTDSSNTEAEGGAYCLLLLPRFERRSEVAKSRFLEVGETPFGRCGRRALPPQ
jgi:hypothetical protein